MSETKQVKVDNWGIFFLQRLKHFFNRTDYCDLTLQFQDNAQLKVHRLVLNACTEYFELLERTCEMYEDCLIMPDDLQADVVVPIVNFMYTGQLEYRSELLERLYQTAQIMNMTVLTKLLDAQRILPSNLPKHHVMNYSRTKRPYSKAFTEKNQTTQKKPYMPNQNPLSINIPAIKANSYNISPQTTQYKKKYEKVEQRPTRYEVPEELDTDNLFDDSFSNLSYQSKPLMVHPETKQYAPKIGEYSLFSEASTSRKYGDIRKGIRGPSTSTLDIVECRRLDQRNDNIFDDETADYPDEENGTYFSSSAMLETKSFGRDSQNQLFDQILNDGPKVTIENKDGKQNNSNLDHAKIISEVLKKYPHLVKSNKNIKLKIVNATNKTPTDKKLLPKQSSPKTTPQTRKDLKIKTGKTKSDTYLSEVIDSQEAARLISLGAENIQGPWICLICGTPGKALHFSSYYKFRRHLVDVHFEKPVSNICEHCGLKSSKRNYLLHHMYTKHDVPPPPSHRFPKCNQCPYVALTEGFLVKHKITHIEPFHRGFRCNICFSTFKSSSSLLNHVESSGHKYSPDRKPVLQCAYCLKVFSRENNLYAHLKTNHKESAKADGIIDDSDEEQSELSSSKVKYEPEGEDSNDTQYQIQQTPSGGIQILAKKSPRKQNILNQNFASPSQSGVQPLMSNLQNEYLPDKEDSLSDPTHESTTVLNTDDYMDKGQVSSGKEDLNKNEEYIIPETSDNINELQTVPVESNTSSLLADVTTEQAVIQQPKIIIKKTTNLNQPVQIVVSSEEEYKALMNSNIIFDDGAHPKAISLLSEHNPAGNANTVDINNSQSNDMMIIQEDYPLSVSEAVTTQNPNIVVVYSHPVDDSNKQYIVNTYGQPQIISSQDIESQFVQTSTVIGENYEAQITTSAPMIGEQVFVQDCWEPQAVIDQSESEPQSMPISAGDVVCGSDNLDMADLPGVEITSQKQPDLLTENTLQIQTSDIENSVIISTNKQNSMPEQEIATDAQTSSILVTTNNSINVNAEPAQETEIEEMDTDTQESDTVVHDMHDVESVEITTKTEDILAVNLEQKKVTDINKGDVSAQANQDDVTLYSEKNDENTKISSEKKIQSLTSEWSDDEDVLNNCANKEDNDENPAITEGQSEKLIADMSETEESIENIQKEIKKHNRDEPSTQMETDEQNNHNKLNGNANTNQENISKLLNDWDENDSQDEATPVTADDSVVEQPNDDISKENESAVTQAVPEKDNEKIKNLVSDWEDEEEEKTD